MYIEFLVAGECWKVNQVVCTSLHTEQKTLVRRGLFCLNIIYVYIVYIILNAQLITTGTTTTIGWGLGEQTVDIAVFG